MKLVCITLGFGLGKVGDAQDDWGEVVIIFHMRGMTKTASATPQHVFGVHRERCRVRAFLCLLLRSVKLDNTIMVVTVSYYK
eukprot:scaffold5189_cov131-Skeletonema_marinoi.AAC.3